MQTAYVWEQAFLKHDMGSFHPESPSRLLAIQKVIDGDGVGRIIKKFEAKPATKDRITLNHDKDYIKVIENTNGREVYLDPDTSTCPDTWNSAILAVGAVSDLTSAIYKREYKNGFAFVRPPGHHAEFGRAMGFCFFNNIAIAAENLIKNEGAKKVAIVDIDIHHGNGTQNSFYDREDVFYASTHRFPFFPGTGEAIETGRGKGANTTLNCPLSASEGNDDNFIKAVNDKIIKAIDKFGPDMLLVSAGFDGHVLDPIGGMRFTTLGYRRVMRDLVNFANDRMSGRVVFVLEGGYDLRALKECSEAGLEVLAE